MSDCVLDLWSLPVNGPKERLILLGLFGLGKAARDDDNDNVSIQVDMRVLKERTKLNEADIFEALYSLAVTAGIVKSFSAAYLVQNKRVLSVALDISVIAELSDIQTN
jgi:hypothetical protein